MKFLAVVSRFLKFKRKDSGQGEIEQGEPEQDKPAGKTAPNEPKKHRIKIITSAVTAITLIVSGFAAWTIFFGEEVQSPRSYTDAWTPLSSTDEALFHAVRNGVLDEVRRCLREVGNAHAVNKSGVTPFKAAIALGREDMIREFVAIAAGDRITADEWQSLLVYAVVQNRPQVVKEMLKLPIDLNVPDKNGFTPLLYAIDRNHAQVARELLDAGADANARGREGLSPLIAAVTRGKQDMVAELLKAGADWNVTSPSGETAMGIARQLKRDAIVALLISAETPPKDTYEEYMKLPLESGDISI